MSGRGTHHKCCRLDILRGNTIPGICTEPAESPSHTSDILEKVYRREREGGIERKRWREGEREK